MKLSDEIKEDYNFLQNYLLDSSADNQYFNSLDSIIEKIKQLENQIEEMKCCSNCIKKCKVNYCFLYDDYSEWEFKKREKLNE